MSRRMIFLTHAEVTIDPRVPVTEWPLSEVGAARHAAFAQSREVDGVTAIYSSTERKAVEGAQPVATRLGLPVCRLETLGENDRSATGYLPEAEFQAVADAFFADPDQSVRGWERARVAQARIVSATRTFAALDRTAGDLLIVAHGAVGALLRCALLNIDITRKQDQPGGGGYWFATDLPVQKAPTEWRPI